jgi:hypothetical protein
MGWRSPGRIIVVVVAIVILIVAVSTWLLIRFELMPHTDAGSLHPTAMNGTQVIMVVAVDANGQPANGFREVQHTGSAPQVSDCVVSPAAVGGNVYLCSPAAAGADACWASQPGSLLCLNDPWDKGLHRVAHSEELPHVKAPASPAPFALLLEDGTKCRLRNGGAWGGRDDGLVAAYGCLGSDLVVLVPSQPDAVATAIDRAQPMWTVKVGVLGAGNPHLPAPQSRAVKTAWYAGA